MAAQLIAIFGIVTAEIVYTQRTAFVLQGKIFQSNKFKNSQTCFAHIQSLLQ